MLDDIAMFFLEQGKWVPDKKEYFALGGPYREVELKKAFSTWPRIVNLVKQNYPEVVNEIEGSKSFVEKPDIQAQLAAAKTAASMELKDGKDI